MLARRAAKGLPTPAWDRRVELFDDLVPVWAAFWSLSSTRSAGFSGAEPIKPADVLAHFELVALPRGERSDWYALIRLLDDEYLAAVRRRSEEERKRKKKGAR